MLASRDLRPGPLYATTTFEQWLPVVRGRQVVLEWRAPAAPSRLLLPVVSHGKAPLHVRLLRVPGELELAAWTIDERPEADIVVRLPVPSGTPPPGRLRLELSSNAEQETGAPWIGWSLQRLGGKVEVGAEAQAGAGPLVVLEYPWPSLALLWLWVLVPLAARIDAARGARAMVLPVAIGLSALATSMLLWQRDYVRVFAHWDADDFGAYAQRLATWIAVPAERGAAEAWFAQYTHAHNPLGPALMAIPIVLGAPVHLVYVAFSAFCSFFSLLIMRRMLTRVGVSAAVAVAAMMLYGSHLLFIRSFARPVTDALGNLLSVGTLALLLDRLRAPLPRQLAGLSLLGMLNSIARPQGLAYVPFVTGAAIAIDTARARGRLLPTTVRDVLWLAILPLATVLCLFTAFGWWSNARALLAAAERYRPWFTASHFGWSLVGTLQLLPLLWLRAGRRLWTPPGLVVLVWLAYYVGMLVAVRAPFWMRHFVPILPAAVLLAAIGLDATRGWLRTAAFGFVALVCLANVAAVVYLVLDPTNLSLRLFGLMTLG